MKLSEIRVDLEKEEEGKRLPHPEFDGVEVHVRSVNLPAFEERLAKLMEIARKKHGLRPGRPLPTTAWREVRGRAAGEVLLRNWWGIEDEEGKEVPYSTDQAVEWMTNPEMRRFADGVWELVSQVGEADSEYEEELGEKSEGA